MEVSDMIQVGEVGERSFQVGEEHLALTVGSGSSRVLATPWMIAFMERVSHAMLKEHLPEGYSSVGVVVNVQHLAPTPFGSTVQVRSEVTAVAGVRVTFQVEAWDQSERIGAGVHERVVIDTERFLRRVNAKIQGLQGALPGARKGADRLEED